MRQILFLIFFCYSLPLLASQAGRDGFSGNPATNGGADCTACHTSGATLPTVVISGPTAVDAATTHSYTVTINGGPAVTGGINVSTQDHAGLLAPVNSDLHVVGSEISHTAPKAFTGSNASFSFDWTAPTYNGDVSLYAAGNSTDGQLSLFGDAVATSALVVTVANGDPPPPPPPPPAPTEASLTLFANGFDNPVAIRHAGDNRLFVVERSGLIHIVQADGSVLPTPFLDISSRVDSSTATQGLLGLAFDPDYQQNGHFYVFYSWDPGPNPDHSRVSRFTVSANPDIGDSSSELVMLEYDTPIRQHLGGDIHFGPDGYLYISSGDGDNGGDPNDYSQNTSLLLGKLLRIDVSGAGGSPDCDVSGSTSYGIPANNAYNDGVGGAGCDEIWALGLRNTWRFSFDRQTGDLWLADVGQNLYEEVNFIPSQSSAGLNLGWRCYEGDTAFNLTGCTNGYFFPIHVPEHNDGDCSITGGFVHRSFSPLSLNGKYLFTDFCNTAIRSVENTPLGFVVNEVVAAGAISQPVTFGENYEGRVFIASLDGDIYRIDSELLGSEENVPFVPLSILGLLGGLLMMIVHLKYRR